MDEIASLKAENEVLQMKVEVLEMKNQHMDEKLAFDQARAQQKEVEMQKEIQRLKGIIRRLQGQEGTDQQLGTTNTTNVEHDNDTITFGDDSLLSNPVANSRKRGLETLDIEQRRFRGEENVSVPPVRVQKPMVRLPPVTTQYPQGKNSCGPFYDEEEQDDDKYGFEMDPQLAARTREYWQQKLQSQKKQETRRSGTSLPGSTTSLTKTTKAMDLQGRSSSRYQDEEESIFATKPKGSRQVPEGQINRPSGGDKVRRIFLKPPVCASCDERAGHIPIVARSDR